MPQALAERLYAGELSVLTDSKQLTPLCREQYFDLLTHTPGVCVSTGWCSAQEIDRTMRWWTACR